MHACIAKNNLILLLICTYSCTMTCHVSNKHCFSPAECWYQGGVGRDSILQTCMHKNDLWNFAIDPRFVRNSSISKQTCNYKPLSKTSPERFLGVDSNIQAQNLDSGMGHDLYGICIPATSD